MSAPASVRGAESLTLRCTADTSLAGFSSERNDNQGGAVRLKCKTNENYLLLDFDVAPIRGRTVEKATLYLKASIPNPMFRKVSVSTVSTAWMEGQGGSATRPATTRPAGGATYLSPNAGAAPETTWAGPGTEFIDAAFSEGGTCWSFANVAPPQDGWFAVPVDPRLVEAMAQGLSFGLAVSCDNGEVKQISRVVEPNSCFGNNYFFSRESGADGPRLEVALSDSADRVAPGTVRDMKVAPWPASAPFEHGAARVTWTAAGDDDAKGRALGYVVTVGIGDGPRQVLPRWQTPAPREAGHPVSLILDGLPSGASVSVEVVALDEAGNRSEPATATGRASSVLARPPTLSAAPLPTPVGGEPPVRGGKLRVWAFGDGLRVNPVNGNLLEESGVQYGGPAGGNYRKANTVWDGATGTVRLRGARGEWVAFQLAVETVGGDAPRLVGVEAALADFAGAGGTPNVDLSHSAISRAWYVQSRGNWYADPLVKCSGPFDVPWEQNQVPGQRNQTLYVEWFIPKDAPAGAVRGGLRLKADGVEPFTLPVELEVLPFVIPDEVHFVWSMNSYGSPGALWGAPDDPKFLAVERDFYVTSHLHRTCLVNLHYRQGGALRDGATPAVGGAGTQARVADWSAFDRRFGPLFDGSAFAGTPRAGVPIDHFYLPFHENWPATMAEGYQWNVDKFEEHWRVCGLPADGFTAQYQDTWKAVLADFARHFATKGWDRTRFQVFLNNKYKYKQYDEKTGKRGEGASFWSLDEPHFRDDFLAVAFFHRLAREALGGKHPTVVLRSDISVPEWQRDVLDDLIDVNVTSAYPEAARVMNRRRAEFGETMWVYGHLGDVSSSALGLVARALRMYTGLADGFVPWQTLGTERAWAAAEQTSAFYPGRPLGIVGCVPSLRLKACRRGEQDVEYLWLLGQALHLDRRQTAALGDQVLRLSETFRNTPPIGSRDERFRGLSDGDLELFRRTIAASLLTRESKTGSSVSS